MTYSDKDLRIIKLLKKGLNSEAVAKKIGYGKETLQSGIERVEETLKKLKK